MYISLCTIVLIQSTWPFNLSCEFTIVTVYIPLNANASIALGYLHSAINVQQSTYSEAAHIITLNFNRSDLMAVVPKFETNIKCATREENTL